MSTAPSPRPSIAPPTSASRLSRTSTCEAYDLGLKGCTTYRPNAVTGAVLSRSAEAKPSEAAASPAGLARCLGGSVPAVETPLLRAASCRDRQGDVVYMAKPLEREAVLAGYTYKMRWPGSDHAMYITIKKNELGLAAAGRIAISPGSRHLDQPERPYRDLERVDLVTRPGDLDHDRALGDVDDLGAEDLADLHHLGTADAVGGDLEDRQLAGERLLRLEIADLRAL